MVLRLPRVEIVESVFVDPGICKTMTLTTKTSLKMRFVGERTTERQRVIRPGSRDATG